MAHPDFDRQPVILTRYETKVHARNRNADYGVPVSVFATSRIEAVDRALAVGWAGEVRDGRVTVLRIEQVAHTPAERPTGGDS